MQHRCRHIAMGTATLGPRTVHDWDVFLPQVSSVADAMTTGTIYTCKPDDTVDQGMSWQRADTPYVLIITDVKLACLLLVSICALSCCSFGDVGNT